MEQLPKLQLSDVTLLNFSGSVPFVLLLPPTRECGKVMFLLCLSVHIGGGGAGLVRSPVAGPVGGGGCTLVPGLGGTLVLVCTSYNRDNLILDKSFIAKE